MNGKPKVMYSKVACKGQSDVVIHHQDFSNCPWHKAKTPSDCTPCENMLKPTEKSSHQNLQHPISISSSQWPSLKPYNSQNPQLGGTKSITFCFAKSPWILQLGCCTPFHGQDDASIAGSILRQRISSSEVKSSTT